MGSGFGTLSNEAPPDPCAHTSEDDPLFMQNSHGTNFCFFRLWMHRAHWMTDQFHVNQLMHVDRRACTICQLQERWRHGDELDRYQFQTLWPITPSMVLHFSAKRHWIAYPRQTPDWLSPLLIFLRTPQLERTGSILVPRENDMISSEVLFDLLCHGHRCDDDEICYVQSPEDGSEKIFWPHRYSLTTGNVLRVIVEENDDVPYSNSTSRCSTSAPSQNNPEQRLLFLNGEPASTPQSETSEITNHWDYDERPHGDIDADNFLYEQIRNTQDLDDAASSFQPPRLDLPLHGQRQTILVLDRFLGGWWHDTAQQVLDQMHLERYVVHSYTIWKNTNGDSNLLHTEFPYDMNGWTRQVITTWPFLTHHMWNAVTFKAHESMFFLPGDFVIGVLDNDATAVFLTQAACLIEVILQYSRTSTTYIDSMLLPPGVTIRSLTHTMMHPLEVDWRFIEARHNDQIIQPDDTLHPVAGDFFQILVDRTQEGQGDCQDANDEEISPTQLKSWHQMSDQTLGSRNLFLTIRQEQDYLIASPYLEFFCRPFYRLEHLDRIAAENWQDLRYNKFSLTDLDPRYMGSIHLGRYDKVSLVIEERPWIAYRLIVLENEGLPQFNTFEQAVYATMIPTFSGRRQALLASRVTQICLNGNIPCLTKLNGAELTEQAVQIEHGDYIRVIVQPEQRNLKRKLTHESCDYASFFAGHGRTEPPPSAEISDEQSFMARRGPRDLSRQIFLYFLGEDEPYVVSTMQQPLELGDNDIFYLFRRAFERDLQSSMKFFHLMPQPSDLLLRNDWGLLGRENPAQPRNKIIALIDRQFFDNSQPRRSDQPFAHDEWRETMLLTTYATRDKFLQEIEMTEHCQVHLCIILGPEGLWNTADVAPHRLKDGAYFQIKTRRDLPPPPDSGLSDVCAEGNTDVDMPQEDAESDETISSTAFQTENATDIEGIDLLQHDLRLHNLSRTWRPSTAREAWRRLPPPGNGVSFDPEVEEFTTNSRKLYKDGSIANLFIADFIEDCKESDNSFLSTFVNDLRWNFDDSSHESNSTLTQFEESPKLPFAQSPISDEKLTKEERKTIILEGNLGNEFRYETPRPQPSRQLEGIDVTSVLRLNEWLSKHFTIGNHNYHDVAWKKASENWLTYPIWQWQPPTELHFFVDGANFQDARGSGCLLFVLTEGQWMKGGFISNQAKFADTAFQAELESHLLASKWEWDILRWCEMRSHALPKVAIHFDNQAAANAVAGHWTCHDSQRAYVAARCLQQLIKSAFNITPDYIFERSHCGNPGNEAADDVAKWASRRTATSTFWDALYGTEVQFDIQWLWILYDATTKHQIHDAQFLIPKPYAQLDKDVLASLTEPQPEAHENLLAKWSLKVTSYNVMTLKGGSPGSIEALFRQLHEDKHQVIFLQETRLRRAVHKSNPWYFTLNTPPTKGGTGGLIVGLSKLLFPCLDEEMNPLYFKEEHLSLVYGDSHLLIAKVDHPGLKALLINGHLPHTGHEQVEVQQWWNKLETKFPRHLRDQDCIFALDSNARIGSLTSNAIGSHGADEQTYGGALLHQWLIDHLLWIPSTFKETHWGPHHTWTHPRGSQSRIDFLAIPQRWQAFSVTSKVNYSTSANDLLHDHHAVELEIRGHKELHKTSTHSIGRKCCKVDYDDASTIWKLKKAFASIPNFSWDIDVHRHTESLNQLLWKASKTVKVKAHAPRKNYLSQETWELVLEKKEAKRAFFEQKQALRKELLTCVFAAWKFRGSIPFGLRDLKQTRLTLAFSERDFKKKTYLAQRKVRNEDEAFFSQFTTKLEHADQPHLQRELWQEVKRYLPKNRSRKTLLSAEKHALLHDQWPTYLCELEAGSITTPAHIYAQCVDRQNLNKPVVPTLKELPTLRRVEQSLLTTQCHKASGLDGLAPDMLKHCAPDLANPCWQLMTKQLAWQTEAIQWKGGELKMIPKPQADHTQCAGFRGIMLSSVMGKRCQALLRRQMETAISPTRPKGQIGGYSHQEALYGAHIVRTNARVAFACKTPYALLFLDLRTAYHHLIRQTVTGIHPDNQDELAEICQEAARTGKGIAPIDASFFQDGQLAKTAASQFLQMNIREANANTWAWIAGRAVHTTKGSRPGSPLADICFMTSMQEVAEKIESFLNTLDSRTEALGKLSIDGCPILWADDIVLQLTSLTNQDLLDMVPQVAEFTHDLFASRGFEINYGRSKTEVLFTLCGHGARAHRQELLRSQDPSCTFRCREHQLHLRVEASYKHLGCLQEAGGELTREIARRIAITWSAFRSLRRLLCGSALSCSTRLRLLQTLIYTKLFYGSGTWFVISHKALCRLSKCYIGILRCVTHQVFCKGKNEKVMSNEELLAHFALPSVRVLLAKERLLYAYRAWHFGGEGLWKAVNQEFDKCPDSWLHGLRADLQWMTEIIGPKWGLTFEETTLQWNATKKSRWKSSVATAVRRHVVQEQLAWKIAKGYFPETVETQDLDDGWMCFCSEVFTSKRALRTHQTTKHQMRTPEFSFTDDTICPCCLLQLWTRGRLMQHLRYVGRAGEPNRCFSFLLAYQFRKDPQNAPNSMKVPLQGLRRRDAIRCSGPLCFGADPTDISFAEGRVHEIDELFFELNVSDPLDNVDGEFGAWLDSALNFDETDWIDKAIQESYARSIPDNSFLFTLLFHGARFPWSQRKNQEQWKEFIEHLRGGDIALEWFDLKLRLSFATRITEMTAHRDPQTEPTNRSERSKRDANVPRRLLQCADNMLCPPHVQATLRTFANFRCTTATLKREMAR